jgi:hypothetical protein
MFLQGTEALSTVAMPELCGVLRLGAHPCQLQNLWPRPPYSEESDSDDSDLFDDNNCANSMMIIDEIISRMTVIQSAKIQLQ